jgi:hypothetical protein
MITSPLLFRPPTRPPASAFRKDSKNIQVCCLDGSNVHCHLVCPWDMDTSIDNYKGTKSLLLFFHGNNEDVRSCISYCQWLSDHTQSNVLTCDYPGYGYSSGDPSEEGMQDTAVSAFDLATSKLLHDAYQQQYADNQNISFLPAIVSTSTRMHVEFLRLLFLQAHRETEAHFTAAGMSSQRNGRTRSVSSAQHSTTA